MFDNISSSEVLVVGGSIWTLLIGYISKVIMAIIETKLNIKISQKVEEDVSSTIKNVVVSTYQGYVKGLKQGREDGKLNEEEKKNAFEMAKEEFLVSVKSESLEFLKDNVGDIEVYIKGVIERGLYDLKKG